MIIDSIQNGIVIDHISAGKSMELYNILGLGKLDCTVAILKNVTSGKLGRKDIIKIDREMDLDWDLIGYVDPSITVNIIRDGKLAEEKLLRAAEVFFIRAADALLTLFGFYLLRADGFCQADKIHAVE